MYRCTVIAFFNLQKFIHVHLATAVEFRSKEKHGFMRGYGLNESPSKLST